jgi:hypothetical protein
MQIRPQYKPSAPVQGLVLQATIPIGNDDPTDHFDPWPYRINTTPKNRSHPGIEQPHNIELLSLATRADERETPRPGVDVITGDNTGGTRCPNAEHIDRLLAVFLLS